MSRPAERRAPALILDLQLATASRLVPDSTLFEAAARAALAGRKQRTELTIRVVGRAESRALNRRYRNVDKATNVLSFQAEGIVAVAPDFLGDIAICAPLVQTEAKAQGKPPEAHWTHLIVHGVLHLRGYDHTEEAAARKMEDLERAILSRLGLPDPYHS